MSDAPPQPVITQEIRIVDEAGRPRLLLSAKDGRPTVMLLRSDSSPGAIISLDKEDRPSVSLANPLPDGPTAALEIDGKGAHVKFDRPGAASSYVFLNNAGTSGLVLIDPKGERKASVVLSQNGEVTVEGLSAPDDHGTLTPPAK